MRSGAIFHPDFFYAPRPSVNSAQEAWVEVYDPSDVPSHWEPGTGMSGPAPTKVWEGYARIQPNKDWRARPRNFAGEFNDTHAVRFQLAIGQNYLGAVLDVDGKVVSYGTDPIFSMGQSVKVVRSPVIGTQGLVGKSFHVRNAVNSANAWLYNVLCDTGTKAE